MAGRDAERIASLFWWMLGAAVVVWLAVMGLAVFALHAPHERQSRKQVQLLVVGGGAAVPTVLLVILLVFGLREVPGLLNPGSEDGVQIHLRGERWWWRVRYELPDGSQFELANEVRLPVGTRVPLWLESSDVVHAFWVPSLAGKVDLIPGRVTRLGLEATRPGRFRGVCAEYCGLSHAAMRFEVVTSPPREFERWTRAQKRASREPSSPVARRGRALFTSVGCGACHTVRGTPADGEIGPDLTHFGARARLGTGAPNDVRGLQAWLRAPGRHKPGVNMPGYDALSSRELRSLAGYLRGLQ